MKRSTLAYLLVFTLAALSLAAALFFFTREGTQPVPFPSAEQIQAAKKQLAEMPAPKGVDPAAWSAGEIELKTPTALDRVIARFKDGTSEEAQNEIISRYDGQLLSSFEFSPYSKSILIPESNRERLANDPDVTEVQSDEPEEMTLAQTVPWSLPAMGVNGAWGKNVKGAGIKVAVIDTGIDVSNPDLFPAVDMPCSSSYYSGKGSLQYDTIAASIDDQFNGHGSHVAGIIAARDDGVGVVGVAPEARLCVIRVLDDRGRGTVDGLIWGIEQAIKAGVHVINVSSGIRSGRIELLAVVLKAIDRGIVFVAGAGNPESGTIMYPAKYPWVIAVTVVDQYDRRYTNYPSGPEIDFAAPGISIRSDCPPLSPICTEKNTAERTGVMSGSSMAAPFVAGQVALLLSQPINPIYDTNGDHTWQPSEVMEVLTASALNPATSYSQGKDDWYGYGILNTGAMLKTGAGTTFACTGSVPPNATLCSGADARIFQVSGILKDTGLLADTPVSLMGQCTGYGYCTYTCQTGFRLENGACAAPTPMGSLTPSADSCVIASGESFCNASFTWTSSNTTSLSLVDTNTGTSLLAVTPANRATPFSVLVANPVTVFELRDGSTVLDRVEIAGDCVTGTRWNGNVCAPPPTVSNVTINDTAVIPDASTQYTITASASNSGGGSGIKSASVIINSEGANKGAYRGLLAWSTGSLAGYTHQMTSCGADASAGSAGIYNGEWNSGAGKEYINLVRCTTAVSENTRTVSFVVTFNPNFTSPTSGNTLSGSVVSDGGTSAWKPFGTFSLAAPVCATPLTRTVTVACDARPGFSVTGSVTRSQTKSTYPACTFGTPVTVDNSTYVSDTCAYTSTASTAFIPTAQQGLNSNFFRNDATAQKIVNGEIPGIDIKSFSLQLGGQTSGYLGESSDSFAYRVVSALRMLGYVPTTNGLSGVYVSEEFLSSFERANHLPVSPVVDATVLRIIDSLLAERERNDESLARQFPLYKYFMIEPKNEPTKEHAAMLFTVAFQALPSGIVLWNEDNFKEYLHDQLLGTSDGYGTQNYKVCLLHLYPELTDNCVLKGERVANFWGSDFAISGTLLHEYAHYIDGNLFTPKQSTSRGVIDTTGFYNISFDTSKVSIDGSTGWKNYTIRRQGNNSNDFVSAYAVGWGDGNSGTAYEDFAESFVLYVTGGKVFRELAKSNSVLQQKYYWLKQNVFNGKEYETGDLRGMAYLKEHPTAGGPDALSSGAFNVLDFSVRLPDFVWEYRLNSSVAASAPAVCDAPLTREVSVSGVSCDLNAAGVAATSGSVTRKQTQTKSAYPACAFPASPDPASLTVDNSTYVSDTCAYPQKVDGGWSAWSPASCPTTCGLDTSSQTRTCTSPVPSGGGAECTADGSSASRACDATPACACSAPLSQEVTVACDAREGFTVTGSVTRIQTKSAYPECAFQTSEYKSDTCEYTPIQCPSGEAYDAATASCVACGNGGCTGAGGTPTNPTGSLVCNNRSTETPAETETPSKTETPCIAPKKIVNGVCLLPASAPPTTPEISGLWRGSAYLGGTAPANYPDGYQLSARATSPSGLNLSYYFEWQTPGDTGAAQWSGWTGSGGWGSVTHYANYGAGTYYARAWAIDASDVWSLAPSAWTPFTLTAPGLSVSCAGSPGDPYIGQPVTWSATVTGGSGSYIYEWNGSDDLFDTVATVQKTYTTPGQKRATLAITDAESRKTASATCTGNVSGISDPTSPTTDVVVKSCTASLTATPSTVEQGLNTTLSWAISDGALCASACAGSGFDTGGEISGSAPASTLPTPPTTSYTLTCTAGTYGPPAPANATVTVIIPEIIITVNGQTPGGTGGGGGGGGGGGTSLRVDPTKPNNVTLSWTPVNPSVGSCVVTKDTDPAWKKSGGSSGSVTDSITTQTTYTVDCTNKQGAHSTKSVVVNALVGYEEF